jgi:hypothetical protein
MSYTLLNRDKVTYILLKSGDTLLLLAIGIPSSISFLGNVIHE